MDNTCRFGCCEQRGAALVEFAFVLLPLLLLTLGILLYGLLFVGQQAIAFSAQQGADAIIQVDPDSVDGDGDGFLNDGELAAYCDAGQALAVRRAQRVLPDAGLLDVCAEDGLCSVQTISGETEQRGCQFRVNKEFPLRIPLIPLPDNLTGVGFVPVS